MNAMASGSYGILFAWILLCSQSIALSDTDPFKPVVVSATFEPRRVGIMSGGASTYISAFIVRVHFDRSMAVRRTPGDISPATVTPMEHTRQQDLFGLTRLVCGTRLVESYPPVWHSMRDRAQQTVTPFYFVPFPSLLHDLPPIAKLFYNLVHDEKMASVQDSTYWGLLLSSVRNSSQVSVHIDSELIRKCEIRFITESDQTHRPTGSLQDLDGNVFTGRLKLSTYNTSSTVDNGPSVPTPPNKYKVPSNHNAETILKLANEVAPRRTPCHKGNGTAKGYTYASIFAELGSSSKLKSLNIGGMLSGVLGPVIEPVTDTMSGVIGDTMTEAIGPVIGTAIAMACTDSISSLLTHSLTTSLTVSLVPSLVETVSDGLTESLSESMRDYLTTKLTNGLTDRLTKSLDTALSKSVPKKVNVDTPARLARKLTHNLGHILTRSLTHSIVPALTHTLLHNPTQDYYCYYCYHYKVYCQLCQYSPSQIYYAMYYSGYYSQYYANYYTEIYTRRVTEEEVKTIAKKAEFKDILMGTDYTPQN
eukprot:GILJ01007158.1.p1 GENE.GILJ01007158.1~~GILJ01007158.1.p1  ORF type:complete len:534 (+),score=60.22 GILJ01007158.1:118-1719(+)